MTTLQTESHVLYKKEWGEDGGENPCKSVVSCKSPLFFRILDLCVSIGMSWLNHCQQERQEKKDHPENRADYADELC